MFKNRASERPRRLGCHPDPQLTSRSRLSRVETISGTCGATSPRASLAISDALDASARRNISMAPRRSSSFWMHVSALVLFLTISSSAYADGTIEAKIDSGDTAWMLVSAALVLMMTGPGLALFYCGLVRRKNVLATMMQSFILMAVVTRRLGGHRLQPGVRRGQPVHRRIPLRLPARRRRAPMRIRPHHPAHDLDGLPADVRDHHARP